MRVMIALQSFIIFGLFMLCSGLYKKGGDPYMDFFPSFNKQHMKQEAYKAGCIMWSMDKNKGELVMKDWNTCLRMAESFTSQDYHIETSK